MSRRMRIYYYAVFGALGGLLSWRVIDAYLALTSDNIYVIDAALGATVGFCLGGVIQIAGGLVTRNWIGAIRGSLTGAVIGAIGGAIGLPLGEWVFIGVGGEVAGRALGWAIFGLSLGLAESTSGGTKASNGFLGGAIGGALGGLVLEVLSGSDSGQVTGKAFGLVLLGASIGLVLALIVTWLAGAWLEVLTGPRKGDVFYLDKYFAKKGRSATIGSDGWKSDIFIGGDKGVAPRHACLTRSNEHVVLADLRGSSGTYVGGRKVDEQTLKSNDELRVGSTKLIYREKRTTRPRPRT